LRAAALLAPLALASCALPTSDLDPGDVGRGDTAIVNGTLERGHPEVVYLFRVDTFSRCTASIIAPRVVLTAHHCIDGAQPSSVKLFVGSSDDSLTAEYNVSEIRPVPNAGVGDLEGNDVALLVLSVPARETPIQIARTSPTPLIAGDVTAIGYGRTPSGQVGTKYTTSATVQAVQAGYIVVEPAVCQGDSGGPAIGPDGLVYGVASFITSPDGMTEPVCGTAIGWYNGIFEHIDFIDAVLEETGTCVPDGDELCNGADDDCDGTADEGCSPIGTACTDGSGCVGGLCADTAAGRVCTSSCDPLHPRVGCGPGHYCSMSGCTGYCLPGSAGALENESPCTADTECVSLSCRDPGDGTRRCLDACRGDAGLCLADEVCAAASGACGSCVSPELVVGSRGLGEPCESDAVCRSGMVCREYGGIAECASSCAAAECPEGFECRDALCVRDRRQGLGGVCLSNPDCGAAVCAEQNGRHWCTARCTTAADCPANFDCDPAGGASVCAPTRALVGEACTGNTDCVTDLCANVAGAQVCTTFCDARNACPPGLECQRVGGSSADAVCVPLPPPDEGGCSATRSGSRVPPLVLLFAAAGAWVRRRSRRP
jgi:V8-like Glu-specific endopeptidase